MRQVILALFLVLAASADAQQTYLINWDKVGDESIEHLVELIQIDSSNPPGNETDVANYLRAELEKEGLQSDLYALVDSRGC